MGARLDWRRIVAGVVALGLVVSVMVTATDPSRAAEGFDDVPDGHTFAGDIAWLASAGITRGCNPPDNTRYCPDAAVTRAQMASFLVRALDLPKGGDPERFADVIATNVHRDDIARLALAGITRGCNPPDNTRYCPDAAVTRAEMATFLVRALDLPAGERGFEDVPATNVHVTDIRALADAGITRGCNPPENSNFCPDDPVTRGQMAAFLRRALGTTTTTTTTTTSTSTTTTTLPAFCLTVTDVPGSECAALVAIHQALGGSGWIDVDPWFETPDVCSWEALECEDGHVSRLAFYSNQVVGTIPAAIGELTHLKELEFWDEPGLTGPLPTTLDRLAALESLAISGTGLQGEIPTVISRLRGLRALEVSGNDMSGSIPTWIGDLTQLEYLNFAANGLSGPIPVQLSKLSELSHLYLVENRLTGTIPAQLGGLSKLREVRLEYNRLTSPAGGPAVPVQLASITTLREVGLHDNRLHGEVPDVVIAALKPVGWINTFWLFGQDGCLTALTPDAESILAGVDPNWNDGCP